MKPPVETIRTSTRARDRLNKLKRATGIENWNILARAALIHSLHDDTPLRLQKLDKNGVEMTWSIFSGELDAVLSGLVANAYAKAYTNTEKKPSMADFFSGHLERGINSLGNFKGKYPIDQFLTRFI